MKRSICGLLLSIVLCVSSIVYASDVRIPQSTLYPFRNTIELYDEFSLGGVSSGGIGMLGWTSGSGTIVAAVSEANRYGVINLSTGVVSGTQARINFAVNPAIDPGMATILTWAVRLNTNDANTTVRYGAINSVAASPPADGIYIEKLDADTNWFCVTRAGGTETRTDSTVAVNTSFNTFTYTRNTSGVQFAINYVNVCSVMTTNIPTTFISPIVFLINSAVADKNADIDYFKIQIFGLSR